MPRLLDTPGAADPMVHLVRRAIAERSGSPGRALELGRLPDLGDVSAGPPHDLVVVHLALEPFAEVSRAFTEAARVLAPGGRLLVVEPHPDTSVARARDADVGELAFAAAAAGLRGGRFTRVTPDDADPSGPQVLVGEWVRPAPPAVVDLGARRAHFDFFRGFDDPFFNLCADVDAGPTLAWCRERGASFFLATLHAVARAVHAVPELRRRLDGDRVVEHARVALGSTVLNADETFTFVDFEHHDALADFLAYGEAVLAAHRRAPAFAPGHRADVVHCTVLPWVHFTSMSHARSLRTGGSVPKVAIGRYREEGGRTALPVCLEVNHALVDGLHVGRFFRSLDDALARPG